MSTYGKLKFILLRGDADESSFPVVDENNMIEGEEPEVRVGTWTNTKNEIKVVYVERKTISEIN